MNYIFYPKCEKNILFPLVGESEYWRMSIIRQQQEQLHAMYLDSTGYRIQCKIHSKNQIQTIFSKYNSMLLDATDKSSNIYITAQTMRTEYSRKSTNVFELRDLYIDLDPRRKDLSDDETKEVCNNSLLVIGNLITEGILACPTFMVFSGSGIQVHWMLKEPIYYKQTKAMTYFDDVQTDLFSVVADALEKSELPVLKPDKAVIGDHARLLRLAGTINQKNGRMTRLINVFKDEGGELYTYCLKEIIKPNNHADKTKGEGFANRKKKSKIITPQKDNRKCFLKGNYKYILCNRIAKLERLQELRNTSGSTPYRELLCFVYYNTSKAIWGAEEAKERSLFFNDRFNTPLSESEVIGTIKRSDANTKEEVYYWKNEKLIDVLNISKSEADELGIGSTETKKRKAKENRIKREERNRRIVETIINTSLTYEEIAKMFKLSLRRIKEIAKQNGIRRYNKRTITTTPAELRNGICEHVAIYKLLLSRNESALFSLISNIKEMVDKQEGYLSSTYMIKLGICPWHMLNRNALDVVGASP